MMKSITLQNSTQFTSMLSKVLLPAAVVAGAIGVSVTHAAISAERNSERAAATFSQPEVPILVATAYTDITLPTLRRGDRGRSVQLLQQILSDNGFLGAAGVRLGNPRGATVNGVFGSIAESAVRDLQQRYNVPVTGQVNHQTWEVLDMQENPY